ncbi:hypothetical protein ACE14D_24220 [Streptomyces sp. Act-28]
MVTRDDDGTGAGARGERPPPADLQAFAVRLRRMNGEMNRLVHGFAASQGLHPTDVQAPAAPRGAPPARAPGRARAGPRGGGV